jgi:hypothetical protein
MGLQLSGSVQLEGNLLVTGSANSVFENISVTNRITANEINVQFVSSSIIYSSGSNRFGDEITDKQQFTGSVDVSGSVTVNGTSAVVGSGSVNYVPKFTVGSAIGNSALFDGGGFGGFNNTGVAARTFVIQAANSRALALEVIENANVHAVYISPNNSGFNRISSDYMSGGVFLPLSLTGRENNSDLVLSTNGNVGFGTTTPTNGKVEIQQTTTTASLWVQTGGTTSDYVIADFRTGTNLPALQLLGNGAATFGSSVSAKTESDFTGTSVNSRILITATGVANTVIGFNNSGATVTGVINNASYVGNLQAYPLVLTTDSVERVRIASTGDGNVTVSTGNLVIGTAGKGIDFSATSNGSGTTTSELLNDYEEGTWTPSVVFVGTPGTVNYISRSGKYTKIGRVVHAEYQFTGCSITGSVGYATITGLPFTMNSTLGGYQSFAPYGNGNLNFPSSSIVYQQGGTGDTKIYPQILNNSGFYSDFTNSNINTGASFTVYALYTYSV